MKVFTKTSLKSSLTTSLVWFVMCVLLCGWMTLFNFGGENITHNQIEFQKLLESKRSNLATEALTRARDAVDAAYKRDTISLGHRNAAETERANRERERYNVLSLNETQRHNLATESFSLQQLGETSRHNIALENEQSRANQASETLRREQNAEQKRSNIAQERIKQEALGETSRANRAQEALAYDRNVEQRRSNLANEQLTGERNFISLNSLAESQRANRAQEALRSQQLAQERELKERELADRYFWQDKVNQVIDNLFGGNYNETAKQVKTAAETGISILKGLGQEAGSKIQEGQGRYTNFLFDLTRGLLQPPQSIRIK